MSEPAERIRGRGWRQGSLLPDIADIRQHLSAPEGKVHVRPEDLLLCVTQTCDLVHRDLIAEPTTDLLHFKPTEKPAPLLQNGRNPRRIQVPFYSIAGQQWYEAASCSRLFIPREFLGNSSRVSPLFQSGNFLGKNSVSFFDGLGSDTHALHSLMSSTIGSGHRERRSIDGLSAITTFFAMCSFGFTPTQSCLQVSPIKSSRCS